jgi:hypothetical protein
VKWTEFTSAKTLTSTIEVRAVFLVPHFPFSPWQFAVAEQDCRNNPGRQSGIAPKQMMGRFRGEAIYSAEVDVHFPQLTVGDTLAFAAEARAVRRFFPLAFLSSGCGPGHERNR